MNILSFSTFHGTGSIACLEGLTAIVNTCHDGSHLLDTD